jgi:hypothetical protein
MNQPVSPAPSEVDTTIPAPTTGGIEDNIMGGTPNQVQIDKDFSDKVTNAVTDGQINEGGLPPQTEDSQVDTSDQNGEGYKPAKEFMDFIQNQISTNYPDHEAPNKGIASDQPSNSPEGDLSDDQKEMQALKGMVQDLASTIYKDRDAVIDRQKFDSINDVYLDVNKEVPEYQRTLNDFFNNALLRDYDLPNISRDTLEGSNKAVSSELDNYFTSRLQAEGYIKSTGLPSSGNTQLGDLTPPNNQAPDTSKDANNRPTSAFEDVDREFTKKVNTLFQQ